MLISIIHTNGNHSRLLCITEETSRISQKEFLPLKQAKFIWQLKASSRPSSS